MLRNGALLDDSASAVPHELAGGGRPSPGVRSPKGRWSFAERSRRGRPLSKAPLRQKMASCSLIKVDSRAEKSDSPNANYGRMAMRKTTAARCCWQF